MLMIFTLLLLCSVISGLLSGITFFCLTECHWTLSLVQGWWWIQGRCCLSENVFNLASFLKDTFSRYRILNSQFISFCILKDIAIFSGPHCFIGKWAMSIIGAPLKAIYVFFSYVWLLLTCTFSSDFQFSFLFLFIGFFSFILFGIQ